MAKKELIEAEEVVTVSDEESAAFARVESMAGDGVVINQDGVPVSTEPEPVNAAESMAAFLMLAGGIAGQVGYKKTAAVWNPETCRGVADRAVPVLRKYPWGASVIAFFEKGVGAEELALFVFLAPVGVATFAAIKADMEPEPEKQKTTQGSDGPSQAVEYMKENHGHVND